MANPHPTQQAGTMPNQQATQRASIMPNQQPTQQAIANAMLTIDAYGWTAVPGDLSNVPTAQTAKPPPNIEAQIPATKLVEQVIDHITSALPTSTLSHSFRVYYYAYAIVSVYFPDWIAGELRDPFLETLLMTCMYHDVATVDLKPRISSHMSFQWLGGCIAMREASAFGAPRMQAESVFEAITRFHICVETRRGSLTRIGQLLRLAVELGECDRSSFVLASLPDVLFFLGCFRATFPRSLRNDGKLTDWFREADKYDDRRHLVHEDTMKLAHRKWPREGITVCFTHAGRRDVVVCCCPAGFSTEGLHGFVMCR